MERPESSAELARKVGCSRATVSAWRVGTKAPSAGARARLERHCGIPRAAWDERSRAVATVPHGYRPSRRLPGEVDEVDELLEAVRAARRDPSLLASERIRASAEERALLALRARLARERATSPAEIERLAVQHPKWIALRDAMIAALVQFPEASAAIADVLRRHGATVSP